MYKYFYYIYIYSKFIIFTLFFSLAIWNTMMGTSLLSVPWAIKQSGLLASVLIGIGMAVVAGYTALLVIKIHAKYGK